jgi:hypothetical protein
MAQLTGASLQAHQSNASTRSTRLIRHLGLSSRPPFKPAAVLPSREAAARIQSKLRQGALRLRIPVDHQA